VFNPLLADIVSACGDWRSEKSLDMFERMNIVVTIFYRIRFPEFSKRWLLTQSNAVVKSVDKICTKYSPEILDQLCNFLDPEVKFVINSILEEFKIPVLDFSSDFDEAEA
jgi:hypothetical protein